MESEEFNVHDLSHSISQSWLHLRMVLIASISHYTVTPSPTVKEDLLEAKEILSEAYDQ